MVWSNTEVAATAAAAGTRLTSIQGSFRERTPETNLPIVAGAQIRLENMGSKMLGFGAQVDISMDQAHNAG